MAHASSLLMLMMKCKFKMDVVCDTLFSKLTGLSLRVRVQLHRVDSVDSRAMGV